MTKRNISIAVIFLLLVVLPLGCSYLTANSPPNNVQTAQTFVGSSNSDKYHYPSCQWAQKIKPENEVYFSTSEEATAAGYAPCKVCSPP